ncbi:flavin reductase family protein [Methanomassiliicoccus luminyensis]|uniref:flavin reductase family protein n=1 Tax=Methanomassiliicoccus luminyensis TaxID=1080712 RepID=UPI0003615C12|nr:flavin reductase family protein [Methanomassiliicoccus luminyensis]
MAVKTELNPVRGIRTFPAFPIVLAVVGKEEKNIITIALVHVFSFNPPLVGIGVSPCRYSHELLHRSPDFTVNIPGKDLVEETIFCGEKSGKNCDKFMETGLTPVPGKRVGTPTIAECIVNLECKKVQTFDTGDHTWFIGEVVSADVIEDFDRERALIYWAGEFRTLGETIRGR